MTLLALLFAGQTKTAWAEEVPSADAALQTTDQDLPAACRPGAWDLTGADFKIGAEVSFNPEWQPVLADIAACLAHARMNQACVTVEGRVDDKQFTADIVGAFGSRRAAQEARAHARAARVISELVKLGVASRQIQENPPPRETFYRGARLELRIDCLKAEEQAEAKAAAAATPEQVDAAVNAAVAAAINKLTEANATANAAPLPAVASTQHLSVDGAVSLSFMAGAPQPVLSPMVALGGAWSNELLYAHLDAGFELGTAEAQRLGVEVSAALGYVFATPNWLTVGLTAGYRISAPASDKPWLEQTWFVGAESTQCLWSLWEGNETCLQETLAPLSFRVRRGEVVGGNIERIPERSNPQFRFDIALVTRHNFL